MESDRGDTAVILRVGHGTAFQAEPDRHSDLMRDCRAVSVAFGWDKIDTLTALLSRLDADLSPRERQLVFIVTIAEVNGRLRVTMGRRNADGLIDRVRQHIAMSKAARAVRAAEEAWNQEARRMQGVA